MSPQIYLHFVVGDLKTAEAIGGVVDALVKIVGQKAPDSPNTSAKSDVPVSEVSFVSPAKATELRMNSCVISKDYLMMASLQKKSLLSKSKVFWMLYGDSPKLSHQQLLHML